MRFGQAFPLFANCLFADTYSIPIDHPDAPNLVHLALEQWYNPTVKSTLGMLRGCPHWKPSSPTRVATRTQLTINLVSLPHLRGIELGVPEVQSELITYLQFPPNVAVGFRPLFVLDICGEISSSVMATMQHVLRVDTAVSRLTLPFPRQHPYLVRFKRPGAPSK